jgi:hypothetical protein
MKNSRFLLVVGGPLFLGLAAGAMQSCLKHVNAQQTSQPIAVYDCHYVGDNQYLMYICSVYDPNTQRHGVLTTSNAATTAISMEDK